MPRLSLPKTLLALPLVVLLAACSDADEALPYVERPVEEIYLEAQAAFEGDDLKKAAQLYDEVERQHPYSQWARRAQLMSAYSHYQDLRYDDAIITLDRYLDLHPASEGAAYALYLKGLCYYEQISDVGRDQQMSQLAAATLNQVIRRFPDTPYARDARLKFDLTQDHLAGKDMEIGRWYQGQQHYNAALRRFQSVVDNYETTSHAPEALMRLTEVYLALGLPDQAKRQTAVLGYNYPGSRWYE
ncbi:MAG: outer membrane protein assembly factor BamD [Alphaproteobacteria bacterium]